MSIKVEQLTKIYKTQRAIDSISFDIGSGEIAGFLGPNGAGKTTTMKILTGYMPPTEGRAFINGLDVEEKSLEVRQQIGYLPEHNPLYTDMYVKEYLGFVAHVYKVKNKTSRIKEIVGMTGLSLEQNKKIAQLSKGYRQRVGLAQALIHNPSVLILDEPTSGLDPNQIVEIRKLILDISKEKTILLSTHIMQEVEAMCSRVMIVNRGKIVANGKTNELKSLFSQGNQLIVEFSRPLTQEEENQLEKMADSRIVKNGNTYKIQLTKDPETLKKEVFKFAANADMILNEMKTEQNSLEEIFKQLTVKND